MLPSFHLRVPSSEETPAVPQKRGSSTSSNQGFVLHLPSEFKPQGRVNSLLDSSRRSDEEILEIPAGGDSLRGGGGASGGRASGGASSSSTRSQASSKSRQYPAREGSSRPFTLLGEAPARPATLDRKSRKTLADRLQLSREQSDAIPNRVTELGEYLESLPDKRIVVQYDEQRDEQQDILVREAGVSLVDDGQVPVPERRISSIPPQEPSLSSVVVSPTSTASTGSPRYHRSLTVIEASEDRDDVFVPGPPPVPAMAPAAPHIQEPPIQGEREERVPTPPFRMILERYDFPDDAPESVERLLAFEKARHNLKVLRPPRTEVDREAEGEEKERNATWLELIYDIFYVAVIRILSHAESGDWQSMFSLIITFVAVWWSWISVTLYDTKYDTDDVYHRLIKFLQMVAVGGFAVSADGALTYATTANIFVASFILIRLTLLINYIIVYLYASGRAGKKSSNPDFYRPQPFSSISSENLQVKVSNEHLHSPIPLPVPPVLSNQVKSRKKPNVQSTQLLILANLASLAFWTMCFVIVEQSSMWTRIFLWIPSFLVDVAIQVYNTWNIKQAPFRGSHLPERMGLFTIIVLGECVIAVLTEGAAGILLYSKARSAVGSGIAWTGGGAAMLAPGGGGNSTAIQQILPGTVQLFETLFISFCFILNVFCFWWMYFDDFASHISNIYKLKNISIFDRMRNLWIYIHLPYHLLFTLCSTAMIGAMTRLFYNELQSATGSAPPPLALGLAVTSSAAAGMDAVGAVGAVAAAASAGSPDGTSAKDEPAVVLELVLVYAFTFFINGVFKLIHTYNSEDWRIKITIFTRFLFCVLILLVLTVPLRYFDNPASRGGDVLSPIAWLIFGLTLCAVIQVIVDVSVQHFVGKSIEKSISRSIHRLSFDQRSLSLASTTARSTHSELVHLRRPAKRPANNNIVRVGEAIPMRDL